MREEAGGEMGQRVKQKKRLLFMGSGGACSVPICSCRLLRFGLGFMVGALLNRECDLCPVVPLVGLASGRFDTDPWLLNLLTILLTFPLLLPLSPRGGELAWVVGFGGISGLGLGSGLQCNGDSACMRGEEQEAGVGYINPPPPSSSSSSRAETNKQHGVMPEGSVE
ncbi:hypothetical protein INR49_011874 [Caranx melampygus]|nr:hypothetical protein INR49_011874 [Caranx melampygus]